MARNRNKVVSDLTKGMVAEGMQLAIKGGGLMDYTNKPGKYIRLNVGDYSGDCVVIMWDDKDPEKVWKMISDSDVIEVDGKVDEYNGVIQIVANNIFKCTDYDTNLFVARTKKDVDLMFDYLEKTAKTIKHKEYRNIVMAFLELFDEAIYSGVGAKSIHHAEVGGWLAHTFEVLTVVNSTVKLFDVDKDLLRCATILHDCGKLRTYKVGASIERNRNDFLLGHIYAGTQIIDGIIKNDNIKIKDEDYEKLIHLILNHHDMPPEHDQVAYTLESIILRKADAISALADRFEKIRDSNKDKVSYFDGVTKMQYYLGGE